MNDEFGRKWSLPDPDTRLEGLSGNMKILRITRVETTIRTDHLPNTSEEVKLSLCLIN
jgi:hypothetical protein